jgi:hypothetical protein
MIKYIHFIITIILVFITTGFGVYVFGDKPILLTLLVLLSYSVGWFARTFLND